MANSRTPSGARSPATGSADVSTFSSTRQPRRSPQGILDKEAAERAEAEAGDYLHTLRPSALDGLMTDLPHPAQMVHHRIMGPRRADLVDHGARQVRPIGAAAVIGLDDKLVAILWLC